MTESFYPASHLAAQHVVACLRRLQGNLANPTGEGAMPDAHDVEAVIAAAFWASLRRQEGYNPTISLAYVSALQARSPLRFERPLPLAADSLAKLAPAVERPGIHLGVWKQDGALAVWGATHTLPPECLVVEVVAPGLLVVKQSAAEDTKFLNIAVLEGDQFKELNTAELDWPDGPPVVRSLLRPRSSTHVDASTLLVHLAASMRRHGRGGSLLIVPPNTEHWRESLVAPMPYSVSPLYSELREFLPPHTNGEFSPVDAIRAIDLVAGLTAVDGASVITEDCSLLAFGVKIVRRKGQPVVDRVIESEPVGSGALRVVHPTQLGGTRHLAAAQFAQDQRNSVALVASQDGRFTVFAWSPSQDAVHAYRLESLML